MNRRSFLLLSLAIFSSSGFPCLAAAHDFAKWENAVAAFEKSDRTNPPPKGAILFVGSSTVVRWKTLAQDFPDQKIINRGFGGNQIADSTHFADRMIFPYEPRAIFLRAGGNDINAGKSPEQVFADFTNFVGTVRAKLPEVRIVFIGLCPSVARWKNAAKEKSLNDQVAAFVKDKPGLEFIDTYDMTLGADGSPRPDLFVEDKLHLNAEGYKLIAARVRPFVK